MEISCASISLAVHLAFSPKPRVFFYFCPCAQQVIKNFTTNHVVFGHNAKCTANHVAVNSTSGIFKKYKPGWNYLKYTQNIKK